MVNCHPTILYNLSKNNNIELKYIKEYIDNRDKIIDECIRFYNVSRDIIKDLFLSLIFLGSFNNWIIKNNIENKIELDIITNIKKDIKKISDIIYNNNDELKEEIKKYKGDKKYNLKSSLLAYYL